MTKGEYGCWQSHAAVNGKDTTDADGAVLVLEDDVCMLPAFSEACLMRIGQYYSSSSCCAADILYLGGSPMFGLPTSCGGGLWRAFVLCTEAYVTLNARIRRQIVAEFENGLPCGYQIDQYLARCSRQRFVYPPIFSQLPENESSIGYGGLMTKCMHFRTQLPCFTAAFMLSLLPILITLLVMLSLFLALVL